MAQPIVEMLQASRNFFEFLSVVMREDNCERMGEKIEIPFLFNGICRISFYLNGFE
jgi:hypothetical protein